MKSILKITAIVVLYSSISSPTASAQLFETFKREATKLGLSNSGGFSQDEAIKGIKEALTNGVSKGTDIVSKLDGYYKNPQIKIPFPTEAQKVESAVRRIGLNKQADDAILSMNRAAEDAAKSAKDIFVNAIKQMTVTDAMNIIKGDTSAATTFLKRTTSASLIEKFTPIIKASLEKVDATKYWGTVINAYNKIPFQQKVNPDLTAFVTQKALDGLFVMIAQEEGAIRRDPLARTSEILKKVFGK